MVDEKLVQAARCWALGGLTALVPLVAAAAEATPTIDKIRERGEIIIGHRVASPPFGFLADNGIATGYVPEICKYVAEYIKKELKAPELKIRYVPADPSNRIPLVQNGTIDLECASTGNTPERREVVAFSYNTFYSETMIAVRKSGPFKSVMDLKGAKIAVPQGTLQQKMLLEMSAKKGLDIKPVMAKDAAEVFLLLETGRADGAINDPILLASYAARSATPADFVFLPDWSAGEGPSSIMMTKGDDRFRGLVNAGIKDMIASGAFQKNYDRWFNVPPYNLPMTDLMRKQMASPSDAPG